MAVFKSRFVQVHVFRRSAGKPEYLLLQRAADEPLYPNLWQMVTGGTEAQEDAVTAAKRELFEETGLSECKIFLVPYISTFYLASDDSIHSVPVFAAEASAGQRIRLSAEHQSMGWHDFDVAVDLLVFPGHKEGLRILHHGLIVEASPHFLQEIE